MTRSLLSGLAFALALYGAAFGGVLLARAADDTACDGPQCCACEPSDVAEPAPLPHLYLPAVLQAMPPMSAEYTPAEPVATPEPEVPVTGDASQ